MRIAERDSKIINIKAGSSSRLIKQHKWNVYLKDTARMSVDKKIQFLKGQTRKFEEARKIEVAVNERLIIDPSYNRWGRYRLHTT